MLTFINGQVNLSTSAEQLISFRNPIRQDFHARKNKREHKKRFATMFRVRINEQCNNKILEIKKITQFPVYGNRQTSKMWKAKQNGREKTS